MPIPKRKMIDCETLEVFDSISDVAKRLNTTPANILQCIWRNGRPRGRKIEYLDFWEECMTAKEKEKYTRKNNIYFM